MKKIILSLAVIFASAGICTLSAQSPENGANPTCQQTKKDGCNGSCENCGNQNKDKKHHHRSHRPGQNDLFKGITLTPEQQSALEALRADRKADNSKSREDRKAKHEEFKNKVKEILTPEQYNLFLDNMKKNAPAGNHRGPRSNQR